MMRQREGVSSIPTGWTRHDRVSSAFAACSRIWNLPESKADLVNLDCDPEAFYTVESFRRAYWRAEMWSKFPWEIPGVDREAVARAAFSDAEAQCKRTNSRLIDVFNRSSTPEHLRRYLLRARAFLLDLLEGITPSEVAQHARWGPGSSTSLPRSLATPANKWLFSQHATEGCLPYIDAYSAWTGWVFQDPVVIPGNIVTFVDKNAKTKRSIGIEPDWNNFFQLGLGQAFRTRLQRKGLLTPIAQEIHQRLAQRASIDGFLATVDLKACSDTIALGLVEALLPPEVVSIIHDLRSPFGSMDGGKTWFPYAKVSSMGNGFTFELETALLWALSKAVAGHASVYGDDIIVPSSAVEQLTELLAFCGMTLNEKKSHYGHSRFRESCGGHFFKGVDVTPVYVRKSLVGLERLSLANNLLAKIREQVLPELMPVWHEIARGVPKIFWGPPHVDGVLHHTVGHGSPQWVHRYQTFRGLRLVKVYSTQPPLQLGSLRAAIHSSANAGERGALDYLRSSSNSRYKWEKKPGVPKVKVTVWYSDWGPWKRPHGP